MQINTSEISRGMKLHQEWVAAWKECFEACASGYLVPWAMELLEEPKSRGLTSLPDVGQCIVDGQNLSRFPRLRQGLVGSGWGGKHSGQAAKGTGSVVGTTGKGAGASGHTGGKPLNPPQAPPAYASQSGSAAASAQDPHIEDRRKASELLADVEKEQAANPAPCRATVIEHRKVARNAIPPPPAATPQSLLAKANMLDKNVLQKLKTCTHRVQELQKRSDTAKKASDSLAARIVEMQGESAQASADASRLASQCATERDLQTSLSREVAETQL